MAFALIVAAASCRGPCGRRTCWKNILRRRNGCIVATAESLSSWSIYLLRCADGTLYTGIATDVERRLAEHSSGERGAKYLRGRGPLRIEFCREVGDRGLASRVEYRIKRLPRLRKEALINEPQRLDALLAEL